MWRRQLWRRAVPAILLGLLVPPLFAQPAYAYLEPGTISFVIQSIVVVILGATLYVRVSWQKVKNRARSLFSSKGKDEESQSES